MYTSTGTYVPKSIQYKYETQQVRGESMYSTRYYVDVYMYKYFVSRTSTHLSIVSPELYYDAPRRVVSTRTQYEHSTRLYDGFIPTPNPSCAFIRVAALRTNSLFSVRVVDRLLLAGAVHICTCGVVHRTSTSYLVRGTTYSVLSTTQ